MSRFKRGDKIVFKPLRIISGVTVPSMTKHTGIILDVKEIIDERKGQEPIVIDTKYEIYDLDSSYTYFDYKEKYNGERIIFER